MREVPAKWGGYSRPRTLDDAGSAELDRVRSNPLSTRCTGGLGELYPSLNLTTELVRTKEVLLKTLPPPQVQTYRPPQSVINSWFRKDPTDAWWDFEKELLKEQAKQARESDGEIIDFRAFIVAAPGEAWRMPSLRRYFPTWTK